MDENAKDALVQSYPDVMRLSIKDYFEKCFIEEFMKNSIDYGKYLQRTKNSAINPSAGQVSPK